MQEHYDEVYSPPQLPSSPVPMLSALPVHMQVWNLACSGLRLWQGCQHKRSWVIGGVALVGGVVMLSNIQGNPNAQERVQQVTNPTADARKFDPNLVVAGEQAEIEQQERNLNAFMEQEAANELLTIADYFIAAAGREMSNEGNPDCFGKSQVDCLDSFINTRMSQLADLTGEESFFEPIRLRMEIQGIRVAQVLVQPVEMLTPDEKQLRSNVLEPFQVVEGGQVQINLDNPEVRPKLLLAQLQQIRQSERQTATLEEQAGVIAEELGQQ